MKMRQKTVLLSLSLAAALAVSGCGGKKDASKSGNQSTAAKAETSEALNSEAAKAGSSASASGGTTAASKASAAEQIARNLTSAKESELDRISQILATKPSEQSAFLAQENKPNGTQNQTDASLARQTQGRGAMQNETQILTAASAAHKNFKDATDEKLPPNSTLQKVALNKRLAQMPQDESAAQTARILAADSNAKAEFELQDGKQTSVQNTTKNDQKTSNLTSYKSAAIGRIAQNSAAKIDERHPKNAQCHHRRKSCCIGI